MKLVCSGAGAAAIACLDLLVSLGLKPENIFVARQQGRGLHRVAPARHGRRTRRATRRTRDARTLADVIGGADVFLGLSGRRRADAGHGQEDGRQADHPGDGQSRAGDPSRAREGRRVRTASIGTGRSDYPNQVNNSLCFPFIFRGALDCGATTINEEMKLAAVRALAELAQAEPSEIVALAYGEADAGVRSGLPHPARLRSAAHHEHGARRSRKAAMDSGVATRPIKDFDAYRDQLDALRLPVRHDDGAGVRRGQAGAQARRVRRRRGRARAARGAGRGRRRASRGRCSSAAPTSSRRRIAKLGLRLTLGDDCDGVNILDDPRYRDYWSEYYQLAPAQGRLAAQAQEDMRTRPTLVGGDARPSRRRRRDAVRHRRQLAGAPALHPQRDRHARGRRRRLRRCRC